MRQSNASEDRPREEDFTDDDRNTFKMAKIRKDLKEFDNQVARKTVPVCFLAKTNLIDIEPSGESINNDLKAPIHKVKNL